MAKIVAFPPREPHVAGKDRVTAGERARIREWLITKVIAEVPGCVDRAMEDHDITYEMVVPLMIIIQGTLPVAEFLHKKVAGKP